MLRSISRRREGARTNPNRCNSEMKARAASSCLKPCSGTEAKFHARNNGVSGSGQHARSPLRLPNPDMTHEKIFLDHPERKLIKLLRIDRMENAMDKKQLIMDMRNTTWNLINLEDWKEVAVDTLSKQHADMVSRSYQLIAEIEQISKNFTNPQKQNVWIEFVYFCESGVRNSLIERSATLERHIKNHATFIYHELSGNNPDLWNLAIGGRRIVNFIAKRKVDAEIKEYMDKDEEYADSEAAAGDIYFNQLKNLCVIVFETSKIRFFAD